MTFVSSTINGGDDVELVWPKGQFSLASRSQPRIVCPQPPFQNFQRRNVRHLWQIRRHPRCCIGVANDTRGTAFVVYEDIYDAKNAVDHLSGFNVCGRYLVVLYYQANRVHKNMDVNAKQQEISQLKARYGVE
ncbi:hypothetical protein Ae201684P_021310 [Aphanomyces euteiches]|nr:hypothetical protein Ae201684P_021310 [Aphanomyces euteiches]